MAFVPTEITSLTPTSGPLNGGTTVVITGQYFASTITCVQFGSVAAPSFMIDSDTQITAVSPAAPNTGSVPVGAIEYTGDVCGAATFTYRFGTPISSTITLVRDEAEETPLR